VAPVAVIDVVTGLMAVPTEPDGEDVEVETSIGVINVVTEVVDGPDPAELTAAAVTVYSVPGVNPVTVMADEICDEVGVAVPILPERVGATVTV
jgi:hypothetical protein